MGEGRSDVRPGRGGREREHVERLEILLPRGVGPLQRLARPDLRRLHVESRRGAEAPEGKGPRDREGTRLDRRGREGDRPRRRAGGLLHGAEAGEGGREDPGEREGEGRRLPAGEDPVRAARREDVGRGGGRELLHRVREASRAAAAGAPSDRGGAPGSPDGAAPDDPVALVRLAYSMLAPAPASAIRPRASSFQSRRPRAWEASLPSGPKNIVSSGRLLLNFNVVFPSGSTVREAGTGGTRPFFASQESSAAKESVFTRTTTSVLESPFTESWKAKRSRSSSAAAPSSGSTKWTTRTFPGAPTRFRPFPSRVSTSRCPPASMFRSPWSWSAWVAGTRADR